MIVAATGVSNGDLLRGVRFLADSARTHSLVMCTRCNWVRFVDGDPLLRPRAARRGAAARLLGSRDWRNVARCRGGPGGSWPRTTRRTCSSPPPRRPLPHVVPATKVEPIPRHRLRWRGAGSTNCTPSKGPPSPARSRPRPLSLEAQHVRDLPSGPAPLQDLLDPEVVGMLPRRSRTSGRDTRPGAPRPGGRGEVPRDGVRAGAVRSKQAGGRPFRGGGHGGRRVTRLVAGKLVR